jgi:endoglucanase
MKRMLLFSLVFATQLAATEPPFTRGVNLTNWLQAGSPQQIQFTKFTKQDFINIKSLGCDVIRLPINLHAMTDGAPNYTVSPLFFFFLDQIIDWAEELELHLILDNHTFDPAANTDPNIGDVLVPVWTQLAERYKDRSNYIYYEVLNEPHGISDAQWNAIQQNVVAAIRAVDQKHTIVIGPAGWNSYQNLGAMPQYADDNLIYTFHFYDPFIFTHQGASWTDPSMVPLVDVPFPYDAASMPACPPELVNTWVKSNLDNYRNEGTVQRVKQLIDIAANFQGQRGVRLFCGEFGVYIPNSDDADRVYWYNVVRSYLEEKGIAWTIWDYTGGFGLFEKGTDELFDYDLNVPLLEALGFNVPPQQDFVIRPDTTGFDFYGDYIGPHIFDSSWAGSGLFDFYSETNPVSGNYCIYWTGVDQYNQIGFAFKPDKGLSELVAKGYAIDFWVRGDTPSSRFDIRFLDTKTDDPNDHPWRMRKTIDESSLAWNGQWHHLQIPLNQFTEHGAWDNGWFEPHGEFDWMAIDRFEIVSEHHNLQGRQFWFDQIRIVDPNIVSVAEQPLSIPASFELLGNYPNPFNPSTTIVFKVNQLLANAHIVDVKIYNALGQLVRVLKIQVSGPGLYAVVWDGRDLGGMTVASGMYVYLVNYGDGHLRNKMQLLK